MLGASVSICNPQKQIACTYALCLSSSNRSQKFNKHRPKYRHLSSPATFEANKITDLVPDHSGDSFLSRKRRSK